MAQPTYSDYLNYQVEDFVMDDSFQQWIVAPAAASDKFWQGFLATYPEKREQLEEARDMLGNIRYRAHTLSREKQENILQQVYAQAEKSELPNPRILSLSSKKYLLVAASISLLLLTMVYLWFIYPAYDTYATGYLESKTILLTDGSEVILNANTSMRVSMDLESNQPREVWLEGEAYFQVQRLEGSSAASLPELKKFIVHTDNFDIEVLGTAFNVSSRSRKSEVLLKSGKVKVASQQIEQIQILQPGDLLSLSGEDKRFQLKKVENNKPLAWRENYFIFENTPLSEVARTIEDYYGLEVEISEPQLAEKIFTASISRDELAMLLKAIEASFGVEVKQEKDIIYIQP